MAVGLRPFLKWVGGKRQLLPVLRRFYPEPMGRYFEPFVGSGAVFFDLVARGHLNGHGALLSDDNADLIGCYRIVRDKTTEVQRVLARLARGHEADPAAHFYAVRERFNRARARLGDAGIVDGYTPALAGMLIYLNRTGFNGLFRLNSKGDFNVPVGRYTNPRICDEKNLLSVAALLRSPQISVLHDSYERVGRMAAPGDFLYFDPPYAPVSSTAHFRSYTADGFSDVDQERLQQLVIALARRGCFVLLSNSTARQIQQLYESNGEAQEVGLVAHRVPARRAINCDGSARGFVEEYLVTNVPPG